jgi:hypothetical protein
LENLNRLAVAVTRLWAGQPRFCISIPGRGKFLYIFTELFQKCSETHPHYSSVRSGVLPPEKKWPVRESHYISPPLPRLGMGGSKHSFLFMRDSFFAMYGDYLRCVNKSRGKHLRGRDLLLDIDIEGRIILKLMLNRKRRCGPFEGMVKLDAFVETVMELCVIEV